MISRGEFEVAETKRGGPKLEMRDRGERSSRMCERASAETSSDNKPSMVD